MSTLHLRMPGRVFEQFVALADLQLRHDADLDLCDALSRPRIRRRGRGATVFVALDAEQVDRLSYWVGDKAPKYLRDYRDAMRVAAARGQR